MQAATVDEGGKLVPQRKSPPPLRDTDPRVVIASMMSMNPPPLPVWIFDIVNERAGTTLIPTGDGAVDPGQGPAPDLGQGPAPDLGQGLAPNLD